MTIFRFSALAFAAIMVIVVAINHRENQREHDNQLNAKLLASKCGFDQNAVNPSKTRKVDGVSVIILGGFYRDCQTGEKSEALSCTEDALRKARIEFEDMSNKGLCVPPVPIA